VSRKGERKQKFAHHSSSWNSVIEVITFLDANRFGGLDTCIVVMSLQNYAMRIQH
jgi:hypothetical protein